MKKNKSMIKRCVPVFAALACTLLATSCDKLKKNKGDEFGVTADMTGSEVLDQLHQKMLETHTKYVLYSAFTSYEDTSNGKTAVDADASTGGVKCYYTGEKKSSYTGAFSREHVWPCANSNGLWDHSVVDKSGYKGGGSDLYHVRAVLGDVNTRRGNGKFYEFKSTDIKYEFPAYSVPYKITVDQDADYANKFEPADCMKGDIARLLVYVYTHYAAIGDNSEVSSEVRGYLGALDFRQVFNSAYSLEQIYEILVRWNENDPVSEDEKLRNNTVEKIQGNRNPFVDHPEYIRRIWMDE